MSLPHCRLRRGAPESLGALHDAIDGRPPRLATTVSLLDDGERLVVTADAADPRPWATIRERDGDLWTEDVVEVFLAPGHATPRRYFELEINPLGTLFDAAVDSPHGDRRALAVDRGWRCQGLAGRVRIDGANKAWRAELAIPWASLAPGLPGAHWRFNVYRIDRPLGAPPEFSAWSPTGVRPADFHRPGQFGFLTRLG